MCPNHSHTTQVRHMSMSDVISSMEDVEKTAERQRRQLELTIWIMCYWEEKTGAKQLS